jgi:hypothetical protein
MTVLKASTMGEDYDVDAQRPTRCESVCSFLPHLDLRPPGSRTFLCHYNLFPSHTIQDTQARHSKALLQTIAQGECSRMKR